MMRAIPAKYDGIQYRSRTEARWARFFDMISVPFDYEREGYSTSSGWYVPDFWLPRSQCWIEIKGVLHGHESHLCKLREVCEETKSYGFVFVGTPKDMCGSFVGLDSTGNVAQSWLNAGLVQSSRSVTETFSVNAYPEGEFAFFDFAMNELWIWNGTDYRDFWEDMGIKDAAFEASKFSFW